MTFRDLDIGRLFTILYDHGAGTLLKCDVSRTIALHNGQLVQVHPNKKVEPLTPIPYSEKLFVALYHGKTVLAERLTPQSYLIYELCHLRTEHCRNPASLQGIPYNQTDEAPRLLNLILANTKQVISMAESLIILRQPPVL